MLICNLHVPKTLNSSLTLQYFNILRFTLCHELEEIESWKNDKCFETSAVATILKEVKDESFVVITGPSGMGKSTIAKLVALQLQNSDGYHILPVMCPKDIVKYLDPNIKQIYFIDDICGKFSVIFNFL
jgi:energy-coupling factor transporter ATP-binding protein EcfA2